MAEITTLADAVAELVVDGVPDSDRSDRELVLMSVRGGVTVEEVRAATGWDLRTAAPLSITAAPSDVELVAMRAMSADIER